MPWPETDVVGTHVSTPVTVYGKAERAPDGELAHEGNRVPDIVALDARRLVVGWRAGVRDARDPSPKDQGAIMCARSEDGGATWAVGTLAEATAEHRYHYVVFLNDGGVLYALLGLIVVDRDRDRRGNVDGFPTALVMRRSTDAGRTWTDFPITVDVPDNGRGVVVAGKPLRHGGHWLVPYWRHAGGTTRAGVLRSADLRTWRSGGLAENPPGVAVEEPQIALSSGDPGALVMVARTLDLRGGASAAERDAYYRVRATHCATATSADAGLTWSPMTLDEDLPNYYVKTFFTRDSEGRHLAIYNTLAGPFTGPPESKPDQYREVLHYKVRRPGEPWGPGRLFADGRRLTRGAARGWDVYPSADEYAPGRFFVVWEHNQINIKVAGLDISRGFSGDLLGGSWKLYGGARRTSGGGFALRSAGTAASGATCPLDVRRSCDFVLEFRGRVDDDSALDPRTGNGVCLGAKVANGARRLMLAVQRSGVWTMRKGSSVWERIHALDGAGRLATWRATVDGSGVARLYRDGADTGAVWVVQDSRDSPQLTHWVTGTPGGNAAAATVEWTRLSPALPEM
ncbi:exo-alpha-sialidase [Planomonospora sp. ID67723]|uniref:sialidase family protein n=1 Tax=Planomonospora sp. ID67723 TaxID=2738134 RepID=UPI0018C3F8B7|nr:sialidase family protein [Planomonospora sp. ID67723]MBG0832578.1 exo-alpha-sialidase [Planomonospora sp. ID67723]